MTLPAHDVRLAIRGLRRSPLFAIVAILSLALGIGANTAIFTLIDQILLRKLPVKDPDELVMLFQRGPAQRQQHGHADALLSHLPGLPAEGRAARARCCAGALVSTSVSVDNQTERRRRRDGLGQLLHDARRAAGRRAGLQLAGGRPGLPGPSRRRAELRLLGDAASRGTPNVVGKKILVNNYPMTIVGVSAAGFAGHRSRRSRRRSACRS